MAEVSNKALAALLVAAIVVSLGGTFMVISKVGIITIDGAPIGMATTPNGTVDITVQSTMSITLDDAAIAFGNCAPLGGGAMGTITSEDNQDTATICSAFNAEDLEVRNNGNVPVAVNASVNRVGEVHSGDNDFMQSPADDTSWIAYYQHNNSVATSGGYLGGCQNNTRNGNWGGANTSYSNFTASTTEFVVCGNLTPDASYNSVTVDVAIGVPAGVVTGADGVNMTFHAYLIA
ncbi:MAG: hypothetical protein ABIC95_00420 [archaeon]